MSMSSTITDINNTNKPNISHTHRISSGSQACAACKYQRRKCAPDCILSPYFPHDKQRQFLNAHKLFGVRNITKIIQDMSPRDKDIAMETIIFQSDMRAKDPVGGVYRIIKTLETECKLYKAEFDLVCQQIAMCRAHQAAAYHQQQQQQQLQISLEPEHDNNNNNNDDPTTSSYEILQEFNDHQSYQAMPIQDSQEYVNAHQEQQQQLHENDDDVGGGEVLNHHPSQHHVQDFQYSWNLQDSVWIPSKESCREGSPVDVKPDHLGHEYLEITSFERGDSFKFDQQAIDKSEMMLKAENLVLEDETEAFQQHQTPEHDLRSAANLFTLTS